MEFNKENLISAIKKIDENPELRNRRSSSTYDLFYEGNKYPPILVLSVANQIIGGKELLLSDFDNNIEKPFKILKDNGFEIVEKNNEINFWIEKTITKNRADRLEGDRALGKALWSPQKDKRGADIYKNMTRVKKGDFILHLVDNSSISGISLVKEKAVKTNGIEGTEWNGPSYLIALENYTPFKIPLIRTDILKFSNKDILENISKSNEVFYNINLGLRQGAYLTPCPIELLELINNEYYKINSEGIPLINLKPNKVNNMTNEFHCKNFQQLSNDAGLIFSPQLIHRFVASLCTKPFVICSGLSGSGKTKLAQAFAQWISANDSQYVIAPVGADWTNREPLLGFPNALQKEEYVSPENGVLDLMIRAKENIENNEVATKPYFLILDEMNLSHVERYFADFLSAMESGDRIPLHKIESETQIVPQSIKLPKNLFIIGTVNIDETTYMFSPKVLDRANTIEFRLTEEDLVNFITSDKQLDMKLLNARGANMSDDFMKIALKETDKNLKDVETDLKKFFNELKKSGAEFGYRTASEIGRLMYMLKELGESGDSLLDIAIMQKLLPKLHGSRNKLTKVLPVLGGFCLKDGSKIKEVYFDKFVSNDLSEDNLKKDTNIKYKISFEKICRMYKNAVENGFASYAEA